MNRSGIPLASVTALGTVRLASIEEVLDGTDTSKAVTPAGIKAVVDEALASLPAPSGGGTDALTVVTANTTPDAGTVVGQLAGYWNTSASAVTVAAVALPAGQAVVLMWDGAAWVQPSMLGGVAAGPVDTTAPTAGTLAASAITQTGFTLTATGAADETELHTTPFEFTVNGVTEPWQAEPTYTVSALTPGTSYTCSHRVADAAGNVTSGTPITVTTATLAAPTVSTSNADATTFSLAYSTGTTGVTDWQWWIDGGAWTALDGISPDTITVPEGDSGIIEVRYSIDGGATWSAAASTTYATVTEATWGTLYADDFSTQALVNGGRVTPTGAAPWGHYSKLGTSQGGSGSWVLGDPIPAWTTETPEPVYAIRASLSVPQDRWDMSVDMISRASSSTNVGFGFGVTGVAYTSGAHNYVEYLTGYLIGCRKNRTAVLWQVEADVDGVQTFTTLASGGNIPGGQWGTLRAEYDSVVVRLWFDATLLLEHTLAGYTPPSTNSLVYIFAAGGSATIGAELDNFAIRVA